MLSPESDKNNSSGVFLFCFFKVVPVHVSLPRLYLHLIQFTLQYLVKLNPLLNDIVHPSVDIGVFPMDIDFCSVTYINTNFFFVNSVLF